MHDMHTYWNIFNRLQLCILVLVVRLSFISIRVDKHTADQAGDVFCEKSICQRSLVT